MNHSATVPTNAEIKDIVDSGVFAKMKPEGATVWMVIACYPLSTISQIAEKTGLSDQRVGECLAELNKAGLGDLGYVAVWR